MAKEKQSCHINGRIRKLVWSFIRFGLCWRVPTFLKERRIWEAKEDESWEREGEREKGGGRVRKIKLNLFELAEREIARTRTMLITRNELGKGADLRKSNRLIYFIYKFRF